jgi:hypothetical protein
MDVNGSKVNTAAEGVRWTEVLRGPGRGAVGAMAMTGMRVVTTELGLVEESPPQAVSRQPGGARALLHRAPRRQHRGLIEIAHWAFGAGGGAVGTLPNSARPMVDRPRLRAAGLPRV